MLAERVGISDPSLDRLGEYFNAEGKIALSDCRLGLDQGSAGVDEGADRLPSGVLHCFSAVSQVVLTTRSRQIDLTLAFPETRFIRR